MNTRSRQLVVLIAILVVIFTFYNLRGNFTALSRLPNTQLHHVDAARREAQTVPFTEREHRLERRPRLEFGEGGVEVPGPRHGWECYMEWSRTDGSTDPVAMAIGGFAQNPQQPRRSQQGSTASASSAQEKYHVVVSVDGGIYTGACANRCLISNGSCCTRL